MEDKVQSATTKVKTGNGFEWLFSMRGDTIDEQMKKIEAIEKIWIEKGWTPIAQNASKYPQKVVEYVEGKVCPLDGGRLVKPQNPRAPIKCENNKWNPTTKVAYGCLHIEWPVKEGIPERQVE